ncbi:GrpB family protein [Candidatus Uabimicrobium amorphum]|uniref:UPF0157 protein YqkA n=1 Tax=Uabimicrobium amorphum TaxID=2596890 RepID=A0A5S9IRF4_UABAM|nr:GrpB family protein [Candidatus Uabimicrobium amorphum]BBM86748.1 UPF0157 protein YqkA [Candidatus Uabimicrobium amorphum]
MKRTIKIVDYNPNWPQEFAKIAQDLRQILPKAIRIDHIGSTSVPNLGAKDIIDIQVTVRELDPQILETLRKNDYQIREHIQKDCLTGFTGNACEMRKFLTLEKKGQRRANIHIRKEGALNQKYALLFRDYLRSCTTTRDAYLQIKKQLASIYPHDIDGYLDIKDPVMDIIFRAAQLWAQNKV